MFDNFFPENRAIYETMWKNIAETGRPQMTVGCKRTACWIPTATNALKICNIYYFSTATTVARTHLNVTSHVHCLSCLLLFLHFGCTTNHRSIPCGCPLHLLVHGHKDPLPCLLSLHSCRSWCNRRWRVRRYHNSWCTDTLGGLFGGPPDLALFSSHTEVLGFLESQHPD